MSIKAAVWCSACCCSKQELATPPSDLPYLQGRLGTYLRVGVWEAGPDLGCSRTADLAFARVLSPWPSLKVIDGSVLQINVQGLPNDETRDCDLATCSTWDWI